MPRADTVKRPIRILAIAALCLGWTGSQAADLDQPTVLPEQTIERKPAVDGINGSLSLEVGIDGVDVVGGTGSVTFPLGQQFGLQVDGSSASFDNDIVVAIPVFRGATHLFWRDPSIGLQWGFCQFAFGNPCAWGYRSIKKAPPSARIS